MTVAIILSVAIPFLLALIATPFIRGWALRRGFTDNPGGHKQHGSPVALGGGITIIFAIGAPTLAAALGVMVLGKVDLPDWIPDLVSTHASGVADRLPRLGMVLAGALALHILGLIDDVRHLGAVSKAAVQVIVAVALFFFADVRLLEFLPLPASAVLTVLWIVLITNAFNFLDNMDGLSAGVAVVAAAIFAVSAILAGQVFVPLLALVLVGALLGFLPYNFSPASIYMGDAGSMVIGYLLGVLTVLTTFYDPDQDLKPFGVLVPLIVLAIPLYDVVSVCCHRLKAGASPFQGDHRHFSHRLIQRGMSTRWAVLTIYLATATTAMSALMLPSATWAFACVIFAQCLCVILIIAILENAGT